jgi:cytochrome P450
MLVYSDGEKWRSRRKLLTPTFHFKILAGFHNVFNEHAKVLVSQLDKVADGRETNIFNYVTLCTLDVICGKSLIKTDLDLSCKVVYC